MSGFRPSPGLAVAAAILTALSAGLCVRGFGPFLCSPQCSHRYVPLTAWGSWLGLALGLAKA